MLWYRSTRTQAQFARERWQFPFFFLQLVTTYSHSRLETYEQCPLKYQFKYVLEIAEPAEFIEQFVGKRVHEALEKLHREQAEGKRTTLSELLDFLRRQWKTSWNERVKIVRRNKSAAEYSRYAEICVRNYYEKIWPDSQGITILLEGHIQFSLDEQNTYRMQGYIDRIARRDDGVYEIHDYKTARHLPSQQDAECDKQLGLYEIGARAQYPEARHIELIWHYVGLGQTLRSKRSPGQLRRLAESTIGLIRKIESADEFPAHKSALCDWCGYRPQCPAWGAAAVAATKPGPAEKF